MNAVAANGTGRCYAGAGRRARAAVPVLLGLAASGAMALDDNAMRPLQVEVSTSSVARFDNTDGSTRASRIDLTWLPPRRSALGFAVGMTSLEGPAYPLAGPYVNAAPILDLGLRWRYTLDSNYRIDVAAWRRLVPPDALALVETRQPSYGARVEMQIGASPKSAFVADRGFLGLQLESGARLTVRRSGGKPMIYYRTRF